MKTKYLKKLDFLINFYILIYIYILWFILILESFSHFVEHFCHLY